MEVVVTAAEGSQGENLFGSVFEGVHVGVLPNGTTKKPQMGSSFACQVSCCVKR